MKTIFKRVSKSTLAIVLTICMLISCMTAAMIATDAAKVDSDKVGSKNWGSTLENIDCKVHGNFRQDGSYTDVWEYTWMYVSGWNEASVTYLCKANYNYYFRINVDGTEFSPTQDNNQKITSSYDSPDNDANSRDTFRFDDNQRLISS